MSAIQIQPVTTQRDRRTLVHFAWRAPSRQLGVDLSGLPPQIAPVASAVQRMTNLTIRLGAERYKHYRMYQVSL